MSFIVWSQILDALPDAVRCDDGTFEGVCPGHENPAPRSLLLRPTSAATRTFVFCRAGCSAARIFAELRARSGAYRG
jgi:hypothetical protein